MGDQEKHQDSELPRSPFAVAVVTVASRALT
jgi:hypothetical protein